MARSRSGTSRLRWNVLLTVRSPSSTVIYMARSTRRHPCSQIFGSIDIVRADEETTARDRVLYAAGRLVAVRRGRGRAGAAVQGAGRSQPREDPEHPAPRPRAGGLRVRVHRPARPRPADGQLPPEAVARGGATGPREARHVR